LQRYVSFFGGKFLSFFVPVEENVFFVYFYFATTIPIETPVVEKPLIEKPLRLSNVRPDLLYENPHARALPESLYQAQPKTHRQQW
jgi:hypothetical protein